jgi:dihydrofolate reductase
MRKVIVDQFMTLDGVVQGPGGVDEDTDGGFRHGGWHLQYFDDMAADWVEGAFAETGGFLFGRRTYEILAAYWPTAPQEERGVGDPLNTLPKYVASRTLTEPLEWQNSTLLQGDAADAVAGLKRQDGKDLRVIGSSAFVRVLIENDLIDEYRLMIDPLLLGTGKRLFPDDGTARPLRLVESQPTTTGALLATYTPA